MADATLAGGLRLREGRTIFAARLCIRCHTAEDEWALTSASMPELQASGPSLRGIGSRLHSRWIAHWIRDPRGLRPQTHMPRMFEQEEDAEGKQT